MIIDTKNKIGVVLPGGGVKSLEAQGAMLQCMLDYGIKPDFAHACSGGALSGAVYFSGINFMDLFQSIDVNQILKMNKIYDALSDNGIFSTDGVEKMLGKIMGDKLYKNLVVNMTDVETHDVYYALGTKSSIICSMSIPKVFPPRIINGTVYRLATPYEYDKPMTCSHETFLLKDRAVYDGGVYDLYPVPDYESLKKSKHIFVLCCPADKSPEEMEDNPVILQAINWIIETMERGFRQMLSANGGMENVTILRPSPIKGPLLNWSENFSVYEHSYKYMDNILKNFNMEKLK